MARNLATPKNKYAVAEGLAELQARIGTVIDATVGDMAKKIWMQAAIVIRDEARRLAPEIQNPPNSPKQWWHKPGVLKSAIFAAYGAQKKPNVIVGVNYRVAGFAHWVEYGTAIRSTEAGANRGQMTPKPYMRPALAAKRQEAISMMADGYRQLIEEATAGGR